MGAELIAHFPVNARPLLGASMRALQSGDGAGGRLRADAPGGRLRRRGDDHGRLSPLSSARTGGRLRVALDPERLHFFDPERPKTRSGSPQAHPSAAATRSGNLWTDRHASFGV